jgi:hypothetical protein
MNPDGLYGTTWLEAISALLADRDKLSAATRRGLVKNIA